MNYLIYETEKREIRVVQISYLILDETIQIKSSLYDYFQVEFTNSDELDDLMTFFEVSDRKYIKQNLSIYDDVKKIIHKMNGCFPVAIDEGFNVDKKLITIHFDYKQFDFDYDESYIKIYNRDKRLKSIGI
jgi:hypothetical protein